MTRPPAPAIPPGRGGSRPAPVAPARLPVNTVLPFILTALGLFSLAHVPMNLDYLLFHMPIRSSLPPGWAPDG